MEAVLAIKTILVTRRCEMNTSLTLHMVTMGYKDPMPNPRLE
jgi:hypothetical protein